MTRGSSSPAPAFRLNVKGADIANRIAPRLISLTLINKRYIEPERLNIQLSSAQLSENKSILFSHY